MDEFDDFLDYEELPDAPKSKHISNDYQGFYHEPPQRETININKAEFLKNQTVAPLIENLDGSEIGTAYGQAYTSRDNSEIMDEPCAPLIENLDGSEVGTPYGQTYEPSDKNSGLDRLTVPTLENMDGKHF